MVSFFKTLKKAVWDAYTSEDFYTSKISTIAKEPSRVFTPKSPTPPSPQRSKSYPVKSERSNIPADISKQTTTRRERCASVFNAPVRLKLPRSSSKVRSHAISDAAKERRRISTQVVPVRMASKTYIDTASPASRTSRTDSGISIGASWDRSSGKSWTCYSPESNSVGRLSGNTYWVEEDECPLYVVQQQALASQRGRVRSYSQGMVPAPRPTTTYAFSPATRPSSYMEDKNNHHDVPHGSSMSMRPTSRSGRTSIFVRRPSLPLALPYTAPATCIMPAPTKNNHQQHFPSEPSRPRPTSHYPMPTKRLSMAEARVPHGPFIANPTYYTHPSSVNIMAASAMRV
ncbi:hypothetical protein DFS34DRAFT_633771 [Phlyctochytrium arcticum]|nr:hypothetical protein DFS34DRAFT_633771 [Phlyctochytrium arcticum]